MTAVTITDFFDTDSNTYSYVVADTATKKAAIIDSVLDFDVRSGKTSTESADAIIAFVEEQGFTVEWHLETHVHADHLSAAPYLKKRLGGKTAVGAHIERVQKTFKTIFNAEAEFQTDGSQFDVLLNDGDQIEIGQAKVDVLHTPGHTPACSTYIVEGEHGFVGDTLFMPDAGTARCDFPGGDAATLFRSVKKLLQLPDSTKLYMCHDYGPEGRDFRNRTTVKEQRDNNIHVRDGIELDSFVSMRTERDATLAMPTLMLPSVQVNMRAGELPPAENNGVRYLKIPLDQF